MVSPLRPVKLPIGIVVILLADRSSTCKLDSSVAVNMVAGTDASWLFWRCTSVRDVRPENTLASRDASKLLFSLSDISDDSYWGCYAQMHPYWLAQPRVTHTCKISAS